MEGDHHDGSNPMLKSLDARGDFIRGQTSLVCLLQGMIGTVTTVELNNEDTARGKILTVDTFMNITLADVDFQRHLGTKQHHEAMYVLGKYIRFVQIPDEVHVENVIKTQIETITNPGRAAYIRRKRGKLATGEYVYIPGGSGR
eukprot:m.37703 g.37703  ORF g.37703 m.37703 type:complete len:144 (-) comp17742_c0_seq1:37-468(-)